MHHIFAHRLKQNHKQKTHEIVKMTKPKIFVFNDESVTNSYGFIIPTKGINLTRFKKNPMMLDSHWNSTRSVLGKWEKLKKEKGLLTGEPIFDTEDSEAEKIAGKVERGFISACSMGIRFNRDDMKYIKGVLVLEKCELYEVSIVAVPSNANSIRLYVDDNDKPLTDTEVEQLCLSLQPQEVVEVDPENNSNKNPNMKIQLTSAAFLALGREATTTEIDSADLSAAIIKLNAEKTAAELKLAAKVEAETAAELKAINTEVDLAVAKGQITADNKKKFVDLGIADRTLLTGTLAAIPEKASLINQVTNPGKTEVKTLEDFQKLTLTEQLAFKADHSEEYQKLFK
jgi:HK97 family phage prohead protease